MFDELNHLRDKSRNKVGFLTESIWSRGVKIYAAKHDSIVEPEHHRIWDGSNIFLPKVPPPPPLHPIFLCCWPNFGLRRWKANNQPHKRPALCPRTHTGDNRVSDGARVCGDGGEMGGVGSLGWRRGGEGSMALPHTKAVLK